MKEQSDYRCTNPEHRKLVNALHDEEISNEDLEFIALFFKALADPTRIRIINALAFHEKVGVCCLADLLDMTISAVSHQLRVLRNHRLVKARKIGQNVFYSLNDEHVQDVFRIALDHVREK